ncbi:hypothetical protein VMCG_04812 [Cytospora schulzeri]|uniref:FAD-binding FR-type domain-containing protein n=1 Tax=Cytospora schulzeri TaxID=448051 RepID=A0A423WMS3_9PEZI|nr:hypothetical protein VMCG_04812 [Valsa malicola]
MQREDPQVSTPRAYEAIDVHIDLEGLPLLGQHETTTNPSIFTRARRRTSYWLGYQPRPLPIVNRVLPSNATSLFIIFWLGLNIFFHIYQVRLLELEYFFCFADRAGYVFIVNLPLLYLLAAKNQPLKLLTGRSYEALNIFHRRVGEFMCFEGVVHFIGMVTWQFALEPDWLTGDTDAWAYFTHPLVVAGIGTFLAYELLYFTSLGSFRQRWYELFLASHVILQVLALIFLYLHFHTARPYVLASLVIFVVDRVIWRLGLKSATLTADLTVLPDGETIMMSANWDKPPSRSGWFPWPRQNIKHGWRPTDHVFLTVPALGRSHALQAHPFTIASAAPPSHQAPREDGGQQTTHCWLNLLIRAHKGFTADLLCYARRHQHVPVRLDGPYGSTHALDMLRAADNAILVAGGSGIAVTFPLVWALLMDDNTQDFDDDGQDDPDTAKRVIVGRREETAKRKVHMLWIIHSDEHRAWIPQEMRDGLVAAGLDLVIPPPTAVSGRPDVVGTVDGWIEEASTDGEQTAVVVSGPDGLNRMVRNTCTEAIAKLEFALVYALYRHQNGKDGSKFSDICLMVIDTRKFPPRTFVKDLEIMPVFAQFQSGFRDLQSLLNLRQSDFYFGEYLSQGDLDLSGRGAETSFETLAFLGLFELVPALADQTNWVKWAKATIEFRQSFRETTPPEATQSAVRTAITIAEGAFGGPWTIPISAMLLSLEPRKSNDRIINEGFKAMFSPAEFDIASLRDMYMDDDTQPELAQFRRLIGDIDRYLSPEETLISSFVALDIWQTISHFPKLIFDSVLYGLSKAGGYVLDVLAKAGALLLSLLLQLLQWTATILVTVTVLVFILSVLIKYFELKENGNQATALLGSHWRSTNTYQTFAYNRTRGAREGQRRDTVTRIPLSRGAGRIITRQTTKLLVKGNASEKRPSGRKRKGARLKRLPGRKGKKGAERKSRSVRRKKLLEGGRFRRR